MANSIGCSFLPFRILTRGGFALSFILFVSCLLLSFFGNVSSVSADDWDAYDWNSLNTFFFDNYHVKAGKTGSDINLETNNQVDRFGDGLLGRLTYSVKNAADWQTQVGNTNDGKNQELLMAAATVNKVTTWSHASIDYNFANLGTSTVTEETVRLYEIDFKIRPCENKAATSSDWGAIIFGLPQGNRFDDITSSSSERFGILFRRNGGMQVFESGKGGVTLSKTFSLVDNWANVKIQFYLSDFDLNTPVDVRVFVNDDLIQTFKTANGFSSNYIEFNSIGVGARSMYTDFTVKSSANYNYDVSNADVFALDKDWTTNGLDKRDVVFQSARDGATEAEHTGSITMGANTAIDVASGLSLFQSGDITGQYTLTKTGEGTLLINAAQGAVDVESLVVSSGRIDAKGAMQAAIEVQSDATFSPGNSVGHVDIDGDFTLDGGTLLIEMDENGIDTMTADSFDLENGTISFTLTDDIPWGASYDILTATSGESFDESIIDRILGNQTLPSYFSLALAGDTNNIVRFSIDRNAVPEPSTWALLLLGAAGLLYWRKRKN
ncbi:MAG: PEP-CTERM sorting domain-containing protein [Thermoguttaceae bacterium]|nr:PEP-CTERM sorting domain-containing protein [Thermoguttaceae bacterium]